MADDANSRYLIIGLGNPGKKYQHTRHNAGFLVVDAFAEKHGLSFRQGRGDYLQANGVINRKKISLIKPLTFMNNSGLAVQQAVHFFKVDLSNILVVVDDFQIPLGTIRIRKQGSGGGHHGLASIISQLQTLNFPRMRIGIGKEQAIPNWVTFVLSDFAREEFETFNAVVPIAVEAILCFIEEGIEKTMNQYNRKND
ncbi:peptidyl-tRNA hydrolase [bacterium BMS3Abin05]|nr:peptidyl-tRNA hydrolase [bacterium BMS3Abin05]GBE26866.1 peptidyl-tRNA hydrolase [bacterium BMS3Bbin03]HDL78294.1 aminoacyl-tRNA hydrolase [Bacteroidota bacterium]HDZ10765.1 aminoacyl-tRNA hydrolase [Bacteroidota bacterium]